MKIKTRLEISTIFFVCVVLAIGLTLFFTSQQVNAAHEQQTSAQEIVEDTFELNVITGDYLLHQEERAISQWYLKYDSLSNHLAALEFKDPDEQAILEEIRQVHEDVNVTFSQLVASYEGEGTNGEETGLQEMLASQLSVKLQDMVSDASLLSEAAQETLMTATQTSNLLVTIFAIVIAAGIGVNSFLIISTIAKPIAKLHEGVEMIGSGNLDHKVGISAEDEIGQLSREFDRMTLSLSRESTERKRAEEKLRNYSEHLGELVEARTRELKGAQKQLIKSEKLAAIGQLASTVGHEIRNPLGVISNSAYFLNMKLKDIADKKVLKHLNILEREVNSANLIVSDLLDFARKKPPILKENDLNAILTDALHHISIPENIKVTTKLIKTPPMLLDTEQIRRVFQNIILNAVQAMPEGEKLIVQTSKHDDSVEIKFKDTGVGIPEENLPRLFTPLFSTKAKGVGLGLSICKQIVEDHGGSIAVKSKVDKGSTFTVKLPIRAEEEVGEGLTITVGLPVERRVESE